METIAPQTNDLNAMLSDPLWDESATENTEDSCQICFAPNNPETSITLKCKYGNHTFCYDCLLESYKGTHCNFSSSKIHRICPYCRSPAPLLPLREGMEPIKGIHRNATKSKKKKQTKLSLMSSLQTCKGIIQSGANKGKKCTCPVKLNGFCGRHQNQVPK